MEQGPCESVGGLAKGRVWAYPLDPGPYLGCLVLLAGAQTLESDSLRFESLLCHLLAS